MPASLKVRMLGLFLVFTGSKENYIYIKETQILKLIQSVVVLWHFLQRQFILRELFTCTFPDTHDMFAIVPI